MHILHVLFWCFSSQLERAIGPNTIHSEGAWISGGSTVPQTGIWLQCKALSVSRTSALYRKHTSWLHGQEKSTGWWLSKGQRGRRAHHELNTADLGGTRRSEGRLRRQDKPHHPLNSSVKGHAIAQTTSPTGSRCRCNNRGRGGG